MRGQCHDPEGLPLQLRPLHAAAAVPTALAPALALAPFAAATFRRAATEPAAASVGHASKLTSMRRRRRFG